MFKVECDFVSHRKVNPNKFVVLNFPTREQAVRYCKEFLKNLPTDEMSAEVKEIYDQLISTDHLLHPFALREDLPFLDSGKPWLEFPGAKGRTSIYADAVNWKMTEAKAPLENIKHNDECERFEFLKRKNYKHVEDYSLQSYLYLTKYLAGRTDWVERNMPLSQAFCQVFDLTLYNRCYFED